MSQNARNDIFERGLLFKCHKLLSSFAFIFNLRRCTMETSLSIRLLIFQSVNTFTPLFYYSYYLLELDKTAAMLAAIMVVGRGLHSSTFQLNLSRSLSLSSPTDPSYPTERAYVEPRS